MEDIVRTKLKYLRMSPRKVRLVANLIKGMNAKEALESLKFAEKAAAVPVSKALKTVINDAENNFNKNGDKLVVVECRVDTAPTLRRGRPVSKGRFHAILKRSTHLTIGVCEKVD